MTNKRKVPKGPVTTAQAKRLLGGSFPRVKGKKYRYPSPSNEKAWTRLVNAALAYHQKRLKALADGKDPPTSPHLYKFRYILFNVQPDEKKKRSKRSSHRRKLGLKVGDKRVVHHRDPKTLSLESAEIQSHCQHKRSHGAKCKR